MTFRHPALGLLVKHDLFRKPAATPASAGAGFFGIMLKSGKVESGFPPENATLTPP
jgi:hypothetical protein